MTRTEARETLMQSIFQMEAQGDKRKQKLEFLLNNQNVEVSALQREYIEETFNIIIYNLSEIDRLIEENSQGWTIKRLPKADLAILRVAIGESLYKPDIPPAVAINEAVKLAKKYSGDQGPQFINGVLGKMFHD